jgi:hypothetical protein
MKKVVVILALVRAALAGAAEVKMEKPREFPHAGISIALPVGFAPRSLTGDYQVLQASRMRGATATQSISLSAFPAGARATAETFSNMLLDNLKRDLAIRHLKQTGKETVKIAGLDAVARCLTYTHRGEPIAARGGVFIRDAAGPGGRKARIAYVLTVEVGQAEAGSLDGLFRAAIATAKMADIKRPADLKIDPKGPFLKDFKSGVAMRLPAGWTGGRNELGLSMGQADYMLDGIYSPAVQVVSLAVSGRMTAEECGKTAVDREKRAGIGIEILEKGESVLAGIKGFQFVLRKRPPMPDSAPKDAKGGPGVIEIRRMICVPLEKEEDEEEQQANHYALIMTVHECEPARAKKIMDTVAGGFSILKGLKKDSP